MQGIHVQCLLQIVQLPWFNKMCQISLTIGPVHLLCKTLSRNRDTFLLNELYWCDAFLQDKFSLVSIRYPPSVDPEHHKAHDWLKGGPWRKQPTWQNRWKKGCWCGAQWEDRDLTLTRLFNNHQCPRVIITVFFRVFCFKNNYNNGLYCLCLSKVLQAVLRGP